MPRTAEQIEAFRERVFAEVPKTFMQAQSIGEIATKVGVIGDSKPWTRPMRRQVNEALLAMIASGRVVRVGKSKSTKYYCGE